ncbi:hypothetical protein KSP40_PGU016906 [Platanthera guangdongensis]|uniref:Uncharacterized protein n=1 Tax=Platanthera guangdongensis TaxID=2320717 RepID=A0ABR2MK17_9ASPA
MQYQHFSFLEVCSSLADELQAVSSLRHFQQKTCNESKLPSPLPFCSSSSSFSLSTVCSLLSADKELYEKLNRMEIIALEMFTGRERFSTLLMMRLTETVILWLSEDQTFWEDMEEGTRPFGKILWQVLE